MNHTFEQREILLNNIDHAIDAWNLKYQNLQKIIEVCNNGPERENFWS